MYKVTFNTIFAPFVADIEGFLRKTLPVGAYSWDGDPYMWQYRINPEELPVHDGPGTETVHLFLTPTEMLDLFPKVMAGMHELAATQAIITSLEVDPVKRKRLHATVGMNNLQRVLRRIELRRHLPRHLLFTHRWSRQGFDCELGDFMAGNLRRQNVVRLTAQETAQRRQVNITMGSEWRRIGFSKKYYLVAEFFLEFGKRETRRIEMDDDWIYNMLYGAEMHVSGEYKLGAMNAEQGTLSLRENARAARIRYDADTISVEFPGKRNSRWATFDRYVFYWAVGCVGRKYEAPEKTTAYIRKDLGGWMIQSRNTFICSPVRGKKFHWGPYPRATKFASIHEAVEFWERCDGHREYVLFLEANLCDLCRPENGNLYSRTAISIYDEEIGLHVPYPIESPVQFDNDYQLIQPATVVYVKNNLRKTRQYSDMWSVREFQINAPDLL